MIPSLFSTILRRQAKLFGEKPPTSGSPFSPRAGLSIRGTKAAVKKQRAAAGKSKTKNKNKIIIEKDWTKKPKRKKQVGTGGGRGKPPKFPTGSAALFGSNLLAKVVGGRINRGKIGKPKRAKRKDPNILSTKRSGNASLLGHPLLGLMIRAGGRNKKSVGGIAAAAPAARKSSSKRKSKSKGVKRTAGTRRGAY